MENFYKNWLNKFASHRDSYFQNETLGDGDTGSEQVQNETETINAPSDIIYESDSLKMIVEKSAFKKQKIFSLQDHLFKFKVIQKQSSKPPLLSDLFDFLHSALLHVLESIKHFYKKEDHNIAYLTLHQDPMVNGLNTGEKCFVKTLKDLNPCHPNFKKFGSLNFKSLNLS